MTDANYAALQRRLVNLEFAVEDIRERLSRLGVPSSPPPSRSPEAGSPVDCPASRSGY